MALLTVQRTNLNGVAPSFVAADAAGDSFVNSGRAYWHVKNADTVDKTVTVNSQTPCSQGFDHDAVVTVPAGGERIIGPFAKNRFDDANGQVQITYSAVTSVTVAVVEVP